MDNIIKSHCLPPLRMPMIYHLLHQIIFWPLSRNTRIAKFVKHVKCNAPLTGRKRTSPNRTYQLAVKIEQGLLKVSICSSVRPSTLTWFTATTLVKLKLLARNWLWNMLGRCPNVPKVTAALNNQSGVLLKALGVYSRNPVLAWDVGDNLLCVLIAPGISSTWSNRTRQTAKLHMTPNLAYQLRARTLGLIRE